MDREDLAINYQGVKHFYKEYSFNKEDGILKRKIEVDGTTLSLNLDVPFKTKKIPDDIFDIGIDIDHIIILRNNYFAERNVVKIKFGINGVNKDVGFVFSLSTLLDQEGVASENNVIASYGMRALVSLLFNATSLTGEEIVVDSRLDFSLLDYYPEDIIICAISKSQLPSFDLVFETSLLFHLNIYGFYYISDQNRSFIPKNNMLQQAALESLLNESGEGMLLIKKLSSEICTEPYLDNYIRYINSQEADDLSRFLLSYQIFELLIDVVSKFEIRNKICSKEFGDKSGYDLKNILLELSKESYRIGKLFKHYSSYLFDSNFHACERIEDFITKYFSENLAAKDYGGYFYSFRNQIVHNLRAIYTNDAGLQETRKAELREIVAHVEFLTVETVISFESK